MKRKGFSILFVLVLVISLSLVAAVPVAGATPTIEVSQPVQVTSNSYYERGESIVYDGTNYWLFYGRSAGCTAPYDATGNPDVHDYVVYYKKASTVAGLASATAVAISGVTHNADSYLGETGAAYFGSEVWAFATIDVGATAELYGWWTSDGGTTWNEVGPIITGLSDGQAHHDETVFNGELWVVEGSGNFATKHSATPKTGGWSTPLQVGTAPPLTGGLVHFFVDGSDLYLAINSAGINYIYKYNSSTTAWDEVDSDAPPNKYDPTLFKVGSDYVFAQAPWDGTKQYILQWSGATLGSTFFDPSYKMVTEGSYGSNPWVDMWPIGFTDDNGDSYLFFTSERNPADVTSEVAGNIWYLKVDWPVTNDHYTYIQEAIDAASSTTINVAAGTYSEGLTIDKSLSIIGSGSSSTFVTGGIKIAGSSSWSGLLLKDLYLKGDYSGNPKDAVIDLDGAPVVSDFTIEGCVLDGEGDSDRMAFYGDNVMSGDWTWEGNEIKAFRSWFLIDNTHSVAPSGVTYALDNVVFKDNWIHDCYGSIAFRGKPDEKTSSVVINGNTFEDYPSHAESQAWAAIEVNIAESLIMYGNSIDGVPEVSWGGEGQALQIWGIDTVDIYDNSFTNCYQGIWVFGGEVGGTYGGPYAVPSGAVYHNNIVGNSDYGIAVEDTATGGPLNCENNWWGDASGPSGPDGRVNRNGKVIGKGDAILGNVDWDPWLPQSIDHTKHDPVPPGLS